MRPGGSRGRGLSRRDFLALAGGAAAFPFVAGLSGCAPALVKPDPSTGLSLGYTSGDVTPDGAVVWLRSEAGASVSVEYDKDPRLIGAASTPSMLVGNDSDGTFQIRLEGLE